MTVQDGRTQDLVGNGELPKLVKDPAAYFIEHNDGLKTTLLMLNGAIRDFNFAARIKGAGIQSCQFFLTPMPNVTYSACLVSKIEEMFATGKAPYPAERTLIVSGMLESCLDFQGSGKQTLGDTSVEREVPGAEDKPTRENIADRFGYAHNGTVMSYPKLAIGLVLTSLVCSSEELPLVTTVEFQPLSAQVTRVVQTLEMVGEPLPATDVQALQSAKTVEQIQRILDKHCWQVSTSILKAASRFNRARPRRSWSSRAGARFSSRFITKPA